MIIEAIKEPSESTSPNDVQETKAKTSETLQTFLRKLLNAPATSWGRANTAGDVLKRRKAVVSALERLEEMGWERSAGGYRVPDGV